MALIYCVEDDEGISELITCALKSGGYDVMAFPNAKDFYAELQKKRPELVLLDIMLPDEDGMAILSKLKASETSKDISVIMLTAKSSELDKVKGLESGADDYITKPFGVMELLSRIKAVLRRTGQTSKPTADVTTIGKLSVDGSKRIVSYDGNEVSLTYKEFEVLVYLMKNADIVITREQLIERVWGFSFEGETRTVDMHIKTLRQKLEQAGCIDLIQTVRGVGYKISVT